MFTGLVEAVGTVTASIEKAELVELTVEEPTLASTLGVGDSVAVAGVCLTATGIDVVAFRSDVARETLRRTTLGRLALGGRVNLELPLRADARLGGHFVQGHVDGVGRVAHAGDKDGNYVVRIEHGHESSRLVVEKGSIAIDGVSLTVTACGPAWLEVMLIPHTLQVTTFGALRSGDEVNLEYDILAKYMLRIAEPYLAPRPD
jgi:riboflavin synthase